MEFLKELPKSLIEALSLEPYRGNAECLEDINLDQLDTLVTHTN